jgi:hypothetical protein
LQAT